MKVNRTMAWIQGGNESRVASLATSPGFPFPVKMASDSFAGPLIDRLAQDPRDVLLIEDSFPFQRTKQFLKKTEEAQARPVIIVLARNITVPASVSLMESGVFTIVSGEYTAEQVSSAVSRAFANRRAFEKVLKMNDSLRRSKGTIQTLNAKVAEDRDRLATINEELNFLLRLATSLHEDPDMDAVFELLCGDLVRFAPYHGIELLSLVGDPVLRTCGVTGEGGQSANPGGTARERSRIRRYLKHHGLPPDGPELLCKNFPAPGGIPAVAGGPGSNRPNHWETRLSFGGEMMGDLSVYLSDAPTEGVERLLRSVAMQIGIFLHNTAERDKVQEMATRDGLTGLYNFRSFREIFGREFERFLRYGRNLSLMMIDLDHFKKVNDTFGHQVGDNALRMIAGIIQGSLRKTDYGFRYGGDEFIVLLPDRDSSHAEILARRIHTAVRQVRGVPSIQSTLTVSIGIADCNAIVSPEAEELLKRTDGTLYKAKEGGRDRIEVAEPAAALTADAEERDAHA
ncbi:MAG: GGDEF domain-containing protein [Candidatus Deferrimicrobiaceae bacterium]